MAEFDVTGLTYTIGAGLSRDDAKAAVRDFFSDLKAGTPLVLQAEPTNMHDENAVAVYMMLNGGYERIGYVKHSSCLEVKTLLDEDGLCDAVTLGNDGKKTMFIDIPNAPETVYTTSKRERVLPRIPLEEVLKMDYTKEEKTLQMVAPRLLKMQPTVENVQSLIDLTKSYLPLSALSICYEDTYWRNHIQKMLKEACKLEMAPSQKSELEQLRYKLDRIEADQTRTSDRPMLKLMESQLEKLKVHAASEDGLFGNFEYHIASSGQSVKEELAKIEAWFKAMPQLNLRDYRKYDRLSECLGYLRISRKELYEVYAALLLLERYACGADIVDMDFSDIRAYVGRVKSLLSADWTEAMYNELWDAILALPAVKAIAKKIGKQQNTTFNRNLIAHILHLMMNKGVFGAKTTNQAMAEALEGNTNHSVRDAVSKSMDDRVMKSAIEKLIEEISH